MFVRYLPPILTFLHFDFQFADVEFGKINTVLTGFHGGVFGSIFFFFKLQRIIPLSFLIGVLVCRYISTILK